MKNKLFFSFISFTVVGVVDEENFHNIYTHLFPWGEEVQ